MSLKNETFPEQLGRYRLEKRIGSGGMAAVYRGELAGIGGFRKPVAIKILHPHLQNQLDSVQSFLLEARVAARLQHPNILPILDVGQEGELIYLVMEYNDGCSLAELRRLLASQGENLAHGAALRIYLDTLQGLHAAHEARDQHGQALGLVHRDVSPQNILISKRGDVRLADFGLVRVLDAPQLTDPDLVKGKLPYVSPEQAQGAKLDRRSDIFSAGVLLWELLTQERIFRNLSGIAILERIARADIPPLSTVFPDAPHKPMPYCAASNKTAAGGAFRYSRRHGKGACSCLQRVWRDS